MHVLKLGAIFFIGHLVLYVLSSVKLMSVKLQSQGWFWLLRIVVKKEDVMTIVDDDGEMSYS